MHWYRTFHSPARLLRWGLFVVGVVLVLRAIGPAAIDATVQAVADQPASVPWYASRILGVLAYLAVVGSVLYGLLLSTGILASLAHRPVSLALHRDLAVVGFGLGLVHGALLSLDRFVPMSVAQLLIPFDSPFRPLWVGFGQVGLYLMGVVIASFSVRQLIGQRTWRALHFATFVIFAMTTVHGIQTGTDSGTAWAWWLYAASVTAVGGLLVVRIVLAMSRRHRPRPSGAETAAFSRPSGEVPPRRHSGRTMTDA